MSLRELYDNYYTTDREKLWYEINAEDKAANIARMCGELGAKKVVDIGAGSGRCCVGWRKRGLGKSCTRRRFQILGCRS
jgi:tRNA G46 methylase TrmB